jgi:hypothetical protein
MRLSTKKIWWNCNICDEKYAPQLYNAITTANAIKHLKASDQICDPDAPDDSSSEYYSRLDHGQIRGREGTVES